MARVDVTRTTCTTFRQLVEKLNCEGFDVDHFHQVDYIEVEDNYDGSERVIYVLEGEKMKKCVEYVYHLNLIFESGVAVDAMWSTFGEQEKHPFDQDPRGIFKLIADEWHER